MQMQRDLSEWVQLNFDNVCFWFYLVDEGRDVPNTTLKAV